MEKDRQTKIIAILALFVGVATLTLGFATFSARLVIQSKATVKPDANTFKVVFSTEKMQETVGAVKPIGNGEEATIDNSGDPKITNLKAKFKKPGQRIEYEFYAVNTGELDAYLNMIEYATVSGSTEKKVCTAGEDTTQSLVDSACNDIRITVQVENDDKACETSTYASHKLAKKIGEKVKVTIEYSKNGALADGPFEVEFGDVTLNYSTIDSETKNVPACEDYDTQIAVGPFDTFGKNNIIDADGNGKISTSDKITLGTESFYVISTDEASETVTMLAEWNLNVGHNTVSGTEGLQNSACKGFLYPEGGTYYCTVAFSGSKYWSSTETSYPAWIYEKSNLYTLVNNYVTKLKELGYSSITGRLIKQEELLELGCTISPATCNSAPSWVKNTSFWSGSARNINGITYVDTEGVFSFYIAYSDINRFGLRPVITINASEI